MKPKWNYILIDYQIYQNDDTFSINAEYYLDDKGVPVVAAQVAKWGGDYEEWQDSDELDDEDLGALISNELQTEEWRWIDANKT
jgi:hypothetical protein